VSIPFGCGTVIFESMPFGMNDGLPGAVFPASAAGAADGAGVFAAAGGSWLLSMSVKTSPDFMSLTSD
jgi:hypothetical protein